jgi:spermidine synthase
MIPRELIDTAELPGGGQLKLYRRGSDFSIMIGGSELMNSRKTASEVALATLAAERLRAGPQPRVLIGGLGMGFTLRAALAALPPQAEIEVVELVPEVIAWARGPLAGLFGASLDDRRVRLVEGDVAERIRTGNGRYDAVLLDVDNDQLYRSRGLGSIRAALRPGGVLAVWSSAADRSFTSRLKRSGFAAEEVVVRSGGERHLIWVAVRS